MIRTVRTFCVSACAVALSWGVAQAHFIFAVTEPADEPKVVKLYLSELAEPDDPALLSRIEKAEAWVAGGRDKMTALELKIDGDAVVGQIPEDSNDGTVVVRHSYGVMSRGGSDPYLLMYHAKAYPSSVPGSWKAVNSSEHLPLEIVPEVHGSDVTLKVLWKGKPASGSQVTVESPVLLEKFQGDTNDKGEFPVKLEKAGLYSIRARLFEDVEGELDGKAYKQARHYSTVALPFTPAQVSSADHQWPDLKKGMTSFGAAVAGDHLYVYGGNYGGGHQYSQEDQSGDFIRVDLKNGKEWETLPGGPKLTGLAMASHDGKLYRVGGFTVTDAEPKAILNSQNSVARFDPAKGAWEDLAPLPEPRSSHDAVVIGDTLYVVGGWSMQQADGKNDQGWLTTAYSLDLKAEKPEWKALPTVPFERRAISAAAHNGKLYVIGGMQSKGGVTRRVAIFDPANSTWSEGPALIGGSMDGFGTAAFSVDGKLIVTTMSGAIQGLPADGSKWEYLGQLKSPRFFHESPAWNHGIVVVGGASMMDGKAENLEFLPIGNTEAAAKAALLK